MTVSLEVKKKQQPLSELFKEHHQRTCKFSSLAAVTAIAKLLQP